MHRRLRKAISAVAAVILSALTVLTSPVPSVSPAFAQQKGIPGFGQQQGGQQACPPPSVMRNGRCVSDKGVPNPPQDRPRPPRPVECQPPQVLRNGRCVNPQPRPVECRPPQVLRNGRCVNPQPRPVECRPPQVLRNGRCVNPQPRPVECRPPQVLRNGRCVDPRPRPDRCDPPRVWRDGRCVLPPRPERCEWPEVWRNGRCIRPRPEYCDPDEVWRNGRCMPRWVERCYLPYVYSPIAGRCILPVPIPPSLPPPSCPAPWLYSEQAGGCICPSGYVVQGGQCVPGTARSCAAPFVYSAEQNRCVCGPGLRPYGAGCAPVNPKPSPQENIVWVQSCLEVAGYDPGPIDGLPGPQTRSAWNQFRADEGFSSEEVPFTDPETIASLFAACQPPAPPPDAPPPAPTTPPVTSPTTPPTTPPVTPPVATPGTAQCATDRLYTLMLEQRSEGSVLEPCGRSCVPPPADMTQADLDRLSQENGIVWCQNCVQVGDLGQLCSLPTPDENGEAPQ